MNGDWIGDLFAQDRAWLERQPGMTPWKDGCARLAGHIGRWLAGLCKPLCRAPVTIAQPRYATYFRRLWGCWSHHWQQAIDADAGAAIEGLEVAKRIQSGRGYQGRQQLGGDPLRDVVLAQAVEDAEPEAMLCLEREYKDYAIRQAIRVNPRVAQDPEDWWSEFRKALGGYGDHPAKLQKYGGKCGLKNWLGTVARNFAREYPPPPPPPPPPRPGPPDPRTPEGDFERQEQARLVREAIDQLPHEDQVLFNLLYVEGLQGRQAAKFVGIDPGNIARHKKKMFERLRGLLPGLEEENGNE